MKNLDYWEYDYLSVTVKTEKAEELTARYATFQWEETEREEDKQYGNVIHITYRRKHRLPHKDRLQLLQVRMENGLNDLSRCQNMKRSKSTAFGLVTGTIGCTLIACGITLAVRFPSVFGILGGIAGALVGAAIIALSGVVVVKIRAREEEWFVCRTEKIQREIESVCKEAEEWKRNEVEYE